MKVDNFLDQIVQEFLQKKIKDKDLLICQHIIKKLQQENKEYKEVIDKSKDKLYCWGEVLDADFQKQMLDILKEVE